MDDLQVDNVDDDDDAVGGSPGIKEENSSQPANNSPNPNKLGL